MFKKPVSLVLCLTVLLSCCSCSNESSDSAPLVSPSVKENDDIRFITKSVSYSFPEFLSENENISVLSRLVYKSFDVEKTNTIGEENEKTPNGYVCDISFLNGKLKRFKFGEKFGLVDEKDNIKLQGNYSSIKQIRPDLFELEKDGEKQYATFDENYDVKILQDDSFDWVFKDNSLSVTNVSVETVDNSADISDVTKVALKTADDKNVYDRTFDSITETKKENYDINAKCIYTAYSGETYYVIVFDEYYNYSVYEGSYGNINVKISDREGNCYILNHDHYVQLLSLTSCFDYTQTEDAQLSDDYVYVDFSVSKNNKMKYLIYNNGYCEISSPSDETGEIVTKKYMVSTECFADVVDWISVNLSEDYEG